MHMIYEYMLKQPINILHEDTVCKENGYYISIDFSLTETNFIHDPYVKVYNKESYSKATKLARIYFYNEVKYVPVHKSGAKEVTKYTNSELRDICTLLTKYWSNILELYIKGCNIKDEDKLKEIRDKQCPNFYKALCK